MTASEKNKKTQPVLTNIQRVTVVQNVTTDPKDVHFNAVKTFFDSRKVTVHHVVVESKNLPEVPESAYDTDLVIVLGGDGTFLRAAQRFAGKHIPFAGINTGTLGFLTRIEATRMNEYLTRLMKGEFSLKNTMMLTVSHKQDEFVALNDVLIKNANPAQLCALKLIINGIEVADYDADGIIVSTPTGSTAYNLSAGGPVMTPSVEAISITPICPHSFSSKAVVVPSTESICIRSDGANQNVLVSVDGQENETLCAGESIEIHRSSSPFWMVAFDEPEDNFYFLLKKKLDWSINPRWKERQEKARQNK